MKPGREIDILVHEKVMGRKPGGSLPLSAWPPHYSTNISAAWGVVEKLGKEKQWFFHTRGKCGEVDLIDFPKNINNDSINVYADSIPLAICLAALKSVGHEVER